MTTNLFITISDLIIVYLYIYIGGVAIHIYIYHNHENMIISINASNVYFCIIV